MAWQTPSQNYSNYTSSNQNFSNKGRRVAAIVIVLIILAAIITLAIIFQPSPADREQQKITDSATTAAQKETPNGVASDVKVANGFAKATVSDPTADGQAKSGNTTIFKVNSDGSMTQLASGSYLSPISLLGLGVPLTAQAALNEQSLDQVKQTVASSCGYGGDNTPGYLGFDGTFDPNWQIDPTTLGSLQQKLDAAISAKNANAEADQKTICVNAIQTGSSIKTNSQTYNSTFTFSAQFITSNGVLSTHTITFAVGPNYYRSYTLDGQEI